MGYPGVLRHGLEPQQEGLPAYRALAHPKEKIEGKFAYVYLDSLVLKRSWGGEIKNVSVLAAIGVDGDGYRRILGVSEGHKEDKAGWLGFLKDLKKLASPVSG